MVVNQVIYYLPTSQNYTKAMMVIIKMKYAVTNFVIYRRWKLENG